MLLTATEPHMPDPGLGEHRLSTLPEPQASPQNGHHRQIHRLIHHMARGLPQWRGDCDGVMGEPVPQGLIAEPTAQFLECGSKKGGWCLRIPGPR